MKTRTRQLGTLWLLASALAWPALGGAQVPVDDNGQPIGDAVAGAQEELTILSADELAELVGPIALYPDDLLAIVLPASTYPLQVVEAARFLENLKSDSSLEPDDDWDDSIVALTNYPEVLDLMNEDLDWTWRLGEAVVAQQTDVIAAIESFRDRAYAAGNLKSDDFQKVTEDDGTIQITPVQEDVIYVPYYEPDRVVVYQPRPVYYYYPRSYPLYYYPYPAGYAFQYDYFWGVTTAFAIGWHTHNLHVWHDSYYGHPYYGRSYWNHWWYRRPDIHVYNNYYVGNPRNRSYDHYRRGDNWHPRSRRTVRSDHRLTRTRYYPNSRASTGHPTVARSFNESGVTNRTPRIQRSSERPEIRFRERRDTVARTSNVRPGDVARRTSNQARTNVVTQRTANQSRTNVVTPRATNRSRPNVVTRRTTNQPRANVVTRRAANQPRASVDTRRSVTVTRPSSHQPAARSSGHRAPQSRSNTSRSSNKSSRASNDRRSDRDNRR